LELINKDENTISYTSKENSNNYQATSNSEIEVWENVGVYYTPHSLTELFAEFINKEHIFNSSSNINILDLFAGDGRLCDSIMKRLTNISSITYLEIRENTIPNNILNGNSNVVLQNGFKYNSLVKYDLIVSNPPYLAINAKQANQMGFTWHQAKENGRNLYGLGIKKGLELCVPGGVLAVIAPFGYLRGVNSAKFRQNIENQCSEVIINASSDRTLFNGVNQDIAFQIFKKRNTRNKGKTKWRFTYDYSLQYKTIHVNLPFSKQTAEKYVRVGPIVWNRKREFLRNSVLNNIAVIYGGNITHDGRLVIPKVRYKDKQYISYTGTIPTNLLSSPFIAIRRTLRGKPGEWVIDSTLVTDDNLVCTAENHVIVAELPRLKIKKLLEVQNRLIHLIKVYYYNSGSPNISTKVVSEIFSKLIIEYI
jgi:methylase of polypeptide subunit release factors